MRPSMATPLTKTFLNRWTPATPVRADFGRWVAYLSTDAAAVRAAAGARGGVIDARAQLSTGAAIEHRDGSIYQLVARPGE
jgi:hypothetical protein